MRGPEHDHIVNAHIRRELGMAPDRSIHTHGPGEAKPTHTHECPCYTCADTMAKWPLEAA